VSRRPVASRGATHRRHRAEGKQNRIRSTRRRPADPPSSSASRLTQRATPTASSWCWACTASAITNSASCAGGHLPRNGAGHVVAVDPATLLAHLLLGLASLPVACAHLRTPSRRHELATNPGNAGRGARATRRTPLGAAVWTRQPCATNRHVTRQGGRPCGRRRVRRCPSVMVSIQLTRDRESLNLKDRLSNPPAATGDSASRARRHDKSYEHLKGDVDKRVDLPHRRSCAGNHHTVNPKKRARAARTHRAGPLACR